MSTQVMKVAAAVLAMAALAGCGTQGMVGQVKAASTAGAMAADTKAAADRVAPPKVDLKALTEIKQGTPSRSWSVQDRVRRTASDALYRYSSLLRDWDAAWGDREKDRIEQRMLEVTTSAIRDIERTTAGGYDAEDRRANDQANRVIDRYRELQRRWDAAWGDRERREIINDMLVLLTGALKDFQRGW